MKMSIWVCLICCLFFTGSALAFNSQITAGIERITESTKYENNNDYEEKGDQTTNEFYIGYTYYLTPVEDYDAPLDLLPFFSRSSYVYGNFYSGSHEWELKDKDFDYTSKKNWTGFGLGGRYYFLPSTGIGLGFFTQEGDWEEEGDFADNSYDESRKGGNISVDHYLNDRNRLSIKLSQTDRNRKYDEYTDERDYLWQWYILNYTGVLDQNPNIYFSIDIGKGTRKEERSYNEDDTNRDDEDFKHDLTKLSATAGPVYRNFAVYLSLTQYKYDPKDDDPWEWEAEETYISISPRYWFSEQLMVGCELYQRSWKQSTERPDNGFESDYEESGMGIDIKIRYRF